MAVVLAAIALAGTLGGVYVGWAIATRQYRASLDRLREIAGIYDPDVRDSELAEFEQD